MPVYKFKADITCDGCVQAIKRSLDRSIGKKLISYTADVPSCTLTLTVEDLTQEQVLEALQKTGKECSPL